MSGKDILNLRNRLGMTQALFGSQYGLSERQVIRLEDGGLSPRAAQKTIDAIKAAQADAQILDSPIVRLDRQGEVLKRKIAASAEDLTPAQLAEVYSLMRKMQARNIAREFEDEVRDELRAMDDEIAEVRTPPQAQGRNADADAA